MTARLRVLLAVLLMVVTGVVAAGPAAAKDAAPLVFNRSLDLALITKINQARAAVGSPPLSATHSVDVYALYSVSGDWACAGDPNPSGPAQVASFGIDPSAYVERASAESASTPDPDAILENLLQDKALLDPAVQYAGLVSVSGGAQCPDTLRTVAVATADVAWFGQVVTMVSLANGKFVTAENGGALPLVANRSAVGNWERFDLVEVSATDITLRSLANGRYVTAEAAGTRPLIANRDSVGTWETFGVIPTDTATATVAFASRANNRWVTAENAGQSPLIANRARVGGWEQFELRGPTGEAFQADQMSAMGDRL